MLCLIIENVIITFFDFKVILFLFNLDIMENLNKISEILDIIKVTGRMDLYDFLVDLIDEFDHDFEPVELSDSDYTDSDEEDEVINTQVDKDGFHSLT